MACHFSYPAFISLALSAAATLASLLFLKYARQAHCPFRDLALAFSSFWNTFLWLCAWLVLSLSSAALLLSQWVHPNQSLLLKPSPSYNTPVPFSLFLPFFFIQHLLSSNLIMCYVIGYCWLSRNRMSVLYFRVSSAYMK